MKKKDSVSRVPDEESDTARQAGRQVEIVKQVRLTSAQRNALVAAVNNGGVLKSSASYDVQEALSFLHLIQRTPLKAFAEVDKSVAAAWRTLLHAARVKNIVAAEQSVSTIRGARWEKLKRCWRLTEAANEYLVKGKVLVTTGESSKRDNRRPLLTDKRAG